MFNIYIKTQKLKLTSHMWSAAFELIWHREASWALTDHINQKLRGYQFGVQLEQRAFLFHKQRAFAFVCGRGHPLPRTYISVPSLPKKKTCYELLESPLQFCFYFIKFNTCTFLLVWLRIELDRHSVLASQICLLGRCFDSYSASVLRLRCSLNLVPLKSKYTIIPHLFMYTTRS